MILNKTVESGIRLELELVGCPLEEIEDRIQKAQSAPGQTFFTDYTPEYGVYKYGFVTEGDSSHWLDNVTINLQESSSIGFLSSVDAGDRFFIVEYLGPAKDLDRNKCFECIQSDSSGVVLRCSKDKQVNISIEDAAACMVKMV